MSQVPIDVRLQLKDQASAQVRSALRDMGGAVDRLKSSFTGLGIAFVGAFAVHRLTAFASESIRLAQVQEQAERRVQSVIRATGQAAGYTLDQLKAMASELQGVTTFGDEAILQAQSLLLTFRNIKGPELAGATEAMLDMATIMGTDLRAAAVQLGKALNDPKEGLSALSRTGVTFTAQQKELIRTLQETGRTAQAQRVILAELNAQFGGAARAELDSYSGATKQLANAWGDFREELGKTVTENQDVIDFMKSLVGHIGAVSESLTNSRTAALIMEREQLEWRKWQLKGPQWVKSSGDMARETGLWRGTFLERFFGGSPDEELRELEAKLTRIRGELGKRDAAKVPPDRWMPRPAPLAEPPPPSFLDRATMGPRFSDFRPVLVAEAEATENAIAKVRWEVQNRMAQQSLELEERTERRRWEIKARMAEELARMEEAELAARIPELEDPMGFDLLPARLAEAEALESASAQRRYEIAVRLAQQRMALDDAEAANRRNAIAAATSLTQASFGEMAGLMRRFYEDSGGQAKKFFAMYKAFSIAETIMATAQAVMNVWAGPLGKYPPAALAFSAMVGAMGAAKVALISRQEPAKSFDRGGIFMSPFAGRITAAEPGVGPEVIAPLSRLPELLRRAGGAPGGSVTVTVHQTLSALGDSSVAALAYQSARQGAAQGVAELTATPRGRRMLRRAAAR